jgi:tRNA threonylcarbamoyladenosine biosynthesis protein TsaB
MIVLALNTVGPVCEAALLRAASDGTLVRSEGMDTGHDARLAPLVQALLAEARVLPREVDLIAVVAGPGSFTGVRVGVSFARGLALALDRPLASVTSLEALSGVPASGRVLALMPARRRTPNRTWWAQLLQDGVGPNDPVEADERAVRALAAEAVCAFGEIGDGLLPDLPVRPGAPSAEAAARLAYCVPELSERAPRPFYGREPDTAPARPLQ